MTAYGTIGSAAGDGLSSAPVLSPSDGSADGSASVQIPDAQLLLLGDYSRQGHDLLIEHDGATILIEDYFGGSGANLAAPNGAFLSADTVGLLAGPLAPGQYAQAAAADAPAATGLTKIGKVVSIEGSATATHSDGVSVPLKDGDPVYQGDVVQTAAGSKLGIAFIDDSVFSMSADARMVLNELIFDPAKAADSSMVVNLVQGSFVFVTGKVAPSGDMKVETPVATMGIRGTTPKVLISTELGVTEFSILPDPDSGKIGAYVLLDKETGEILGTVESVGDKWVITSLSGEAVKVAKSGLDLLEDEIAMADIRAAVSSALGDRTLLEGSGSYFQIAYNASSSAGGQGSTGGENGGGGTGGDGGAIVDPTPGKDDAPIANADAVTTGEEDDASSGELVALTGNVFSSNGSGADYDPDGFGITLISVNGTALASWGGNLPSGATLAMTATGGFTYRPNNAFETIGLGETATDIFTYTIRDPGGFTGTGTVTVTITGRNDQPLIEASSVLTDAFSEQTGVTDSPTVLSADGVIGFSDIDTTDLHSVPIPAFVSAVWNAGVDPTSDPGALAIHPVDQGADSAGWTYTIADNAVDFLGVGETLTITYTVTVMDDSGAGTGDTDGNQTATSIAKQVVVTITGTNDAPEITAGPVAIQIAESSEEGGVGGGFSGDPVTGTLAFTDVDVTDTGFGYEVVSVQETPEGGALGHPTLNNGQLKALLSLAGSSDDGTAATDGEIVWTFTGSEQQFDYLAAGESVTLLYTIQVRDEHNAVSNQQTITVTITGASDGDENDAPVISIETGDLATAGLTETNGGLSISDTLTVTEIDRTDTVELSIAGMQVSNLSTDPSSARPSQAALEDMFSLTKDDVLSDTVDTVENFGWAFNSGSTNFDYLAAGEKLVLVYTIEAGDGIDTDTQTVTVTITGTNDVPVITSTAGGGALVEAAAQTGQPGPPLTADGTIAFTDVDVSENAHAATEAVAATGAINGLALNNAGLLSLFDTTVNQTGVAGIDGTVDWQFSAQDQAFDYLADGEVLTLTYVVTITDAQGATASQDVTITITGTNDQPVIAASSVLADTIIEQPATTGAVTPMTADGSISFSDVDTTDLHSVVAPVFVSAEWSGGPGPASDPGSLVIGAVNQATNSASWTYTVADGALDYLAAGETLIITYDIAVRDDSATGNNTSTVQQIVVTITGTNDQPVIEAAGLADTILEQTATIGSVTPMTADGTIVFGDVDTTDEHSVVAPVFVSAEWSGGPDPASDPGSLVIGTVNQASNSAAWTYTVADGALDYLADGETLTITYNVAVRDDSATGNNTSTVQQIVVTITGTNDQPVIEATSALADTILEQAATTGAATPMTADGTIVFGDVDTTDEHSVVAPTLASVEWSGGPDPASDPGSLVIGTVNQASNSAAWTYTVADGALDYLADGETLTITYDVAVRDDSATGNNTSAVQQVVVTITGTNDQPVVAAITQTDLGEQTGTGALTASIAVVFADVDLGDNGHTASVTEVSVTGEDGGLALSEAQLLDLLTPGTVTKTAGSDAGSLTLDFSATAAAFDYLAADETVTLTYTIAVDDGDGSIGTQTFVVEISGTNDAPAISLAGGDSAAETVAEDAGGLMASGTLTVVDIDLSDAVTASVDGVVAGGTTAGLVPDPAALAAMLTLTAGSIDADSGAAGNLDWSFDSGAEAFDYLADGEELTLAYTVTVTDGSGVTGSRTVTITVTGTNDQPEITAAVGEDDGEITEDLGTQSDSGTLSFTDADLSDTPIASKALDLDSVTALTADGVTEFSLTPDQIDALEGAFTVALGSGSANDGAVEWSFDLDGVDLSYLGEGETVTAVFTVTLDDGNGGNTSKDVTVVINGVNGGDRDDTLTGTPDPDLLLGGLGADILFGLGDDDHLEGGGGHDLLDGGAGDDMLVGGSGDDHLAGGEGTDTYVGGDGPDQYDAMSFRHETGSGGVTVDLALGTVTDTYGNNELLTGIEEVDGSAGNDVLIGNADDNYFRGFAGVDAYDGGAGGHDQVAFDSEDGGEGAVIDLSTGLGTDTWGNAETFTGIEVLRGSQYDDEFTGDDSDNVFLGLAGNDIIDGGLGEDMVRYDRDVNWNGLGGATVDLAAGTAEDGFGDMDMLTGIEHARGTETADSLTGNDLYNRLEGLGGADMLMGGLGDDELIGGLGDDELFGGDGSDQLTGGADADAFVFLAGEGGVDQILDFGTEEDSIVLYGFDEVTTVVSLADNGSGGSNLVVNSQIVASLDGISHTTDFSIDYNADHHVITMMSMV
jgi:VCBS repeat-containing protein